MGAAQQALLAAKPAAVASAFSWTAETMPAVQDLAFASRDATFTGVNFGVGLGIIMVGSSARSVFTVSVDGLPATKVAASAPHNPTAAQVVVSVWKIAISSAGAKTVVTSAETAALARIGISTGTIVGANATEASTAIKGFNYGADPQVTTSSLTVPSGGVGLVILGSEGTFAFTWNVGTKENEAATGGGGGMTSGRMTSSGTPSISGANFAGSCIASASWGP